MLAGRALAFEERAFVAGRNESWLTAKLLAEPIAISQSRVVEKAGDLLQPDAIAVSEDRPPVGSVNRLEYLIAIHLVGGKPAAL